MKKEVISKAKLLRLLEYFMQENAERVFDLEHSNAEWEDPDLLMRLRSVGITFNYIRTLIENESAFNATLDRLVKEYMIK